MPIRLDQRLTAIANLADYGKVADVGCDHGKLGYYLVSTDRASEVIATDVSAPSLEKAKELAFENGVSDVMHARLGDGLDCVASEEVDTVIIAGLGGDVISGILQRARKDGKTFSSFILSPNTHPEKVRREIVASNHTIVVDRLLECGGKIYTIIKTRKGESSLDDMQILFGAFYKQSDDFAFYAQKELDALCDIVKRNPEAQLKGRIDLLKSALGDRIHKEEQDENN